MKQVIMEKINFYKMRECDQNFPFCVLFNLNIVKTLSHSPIKTVTSNTRIKCFAHRNIPSVFQYKTKKNKDKIKTAQKTITKTFLERNGIMCNKYDTKKKTKQHHAFLNKTKQPKKTNLTNKINFLVVMYIWSQYIMLISKMTGKKLYNTQKPKSNQRVQNQLEEKAIYITFPLDQLNLMFLSVWFFKKNKTSLTVVCMQLFIDILF
ncbi:hypothetical protein RFI_32092 [Reticulomyxa filosa]|uniref:Transmembrane protein n=1 Tax=Reticulomyxa filosa TaxID=46433 RepID=X6LX43_RETFI|nr:hypothetical protein RFI_32092 [Reticulomyxa filosa]|eukprot:ETO05305.1 hypothetical protein RFI_32092 [Reticulomyxa filosa]